MLSSPDFKDLLSLFGKYRTRFLVVGGYAVMNYTEPRYTKDLDIWVSTEKSNARAVFSALREFGAPLQGLDAQDFAAEGYLYQMGMPPFRVDVMMSVKGLDFDESWSRRVEVEVGGVVVPFISKKDLIAAKKASGRPQDLLDVAKLELER